MSQNFQPQRGAPMQPTDYKQDPLNSTCKCQVSEA